ncbi:hypothetical protein NP493_837g01005 [Ridgeia piscesae]|uniref:Chitin-binding type-2 domain-containing protein n=1 Tax=Ridgeia piscesae TaxID=27915 RepID=A0AAD9NNV7_RIDPI|nr:hypothetical protein NP493_837g01005 [Ridgeia piscesae]
MYINIFVGPYPDCRRCNYTKGQVWFPDPKNCHLYYICDKIDRMDGSWYFRVYHPTCGQLFWDQDRLTCVRSVPKNADCDIGDVVTWDPPSTTYAPCPYKRMADPRFFQSKDNDLEIFQCTVGFEFFDSDDPCTCIPVKAIDPTCDNELLLHFPYEIDFDDITCHKAKGYSYGQDGGHVKIVYDNDRQENVAEFDGKSRIEVPFMRNWLQDQNQQAWTVTAWVKREQGPYDYVGIVDNGDCKDSASFLLYGNVESGNAVAYGGIAANSGFPATVTGSYVMPYNAWVQLGVVYNGHDVKLYVNGVLQNVLTVPLGGAMLNTQNPLYIGMQGCCDENPGYFKGRIDDVSDIHLVAKT